MDSMSKRTDKEERLSIPQQNNALKVCHRVDFQVKAKETLRSDPRSVFFWQVASDDYCKLCQNSVCSRHENLPIIVMIPSRIIDTLLFLSPIYGGCAVRSKQQFSLKGHSEVESTTFC